MKYRMLIQRLDELNNHSLTEENAGAEYTAAAPDKKTATLILQGMAFENNWTYYGSVSKIEEVK